MPFTRLCCNAQVTYEVMNDIYLNDRKVYSKGDKLINPKVLSITKINGEEKVSPLGEPTAKRMLLTDNEEVEIKREDIRLIEILRQ